MLFILIISICNDGCDYNSVDYENQRFICDCSIDGKSSVYLVEEKKEEESYADYFLSLINYKIAICYKLFFEFSNFYYNAGFYISFATLFIFLIMMLLFCTKGIKKLRLIFYENIPTDVIFKDDFKNNNIKIAQYPKYKRRNSKKRTTKIKMDTSENLFNKPNKDKIKLSTRKSNNSQKKSKSNPNPKRKTKKKVTIKMNEKSERELSIKKRKGKSKTLIQKVPIINKIKNKLNKKTKNYNIITKGESIKNDLFIDFNFDHLITINDKEIEN